MLVYVFAGVVDASVYIPVVVAVVYVSFCQALHSHLASSSGALAAASGAWVAAAAAHNLLGGGASLSAAAAAAVVAIGFSPPHQHLPLCHPPICFLFPPRQQPLWRPLHFLPEFA